jgi:hypothetical protein
MPELLGAGAGAAAISGLIGRNLKTLDLLSWIFLNLSLALF